MLFVQPAADESDRYVESRAAVSAGSGALRDSAPALGVTMPRTSPRVSGTIMLVSERLTLNTFAARDRPSTGNRTSEILIPRKDGSARASVDDAELVRAGVTGQEWAQREIWFRFAPMVHAFLRRILGARLDPEDLVQEAFLRVFAKLGELESPEALRSFIYSVAVRVASEEFRRHRVRSRIASIFFGAVVEPSVPHVDFEARELLGRIQGVLDGMDARLRAVFVLRRFEGMELTHIADHLDLSLATVKRDLDKASRYLAKAIHRDPILLARLESDAGLPTEGGHA